MPRVLGSGSGVGKGCCLGWKLHCPSFGGLGGHPVLPALPRLSREPSLSLTPAPRNCRRPQAARGRKQPTLSCPLPPPTVLGPRRVALPVWGRQLPPGRSQGVVASWLEESDLCPHPPPPQLIMLQSDLLLLIFLFFAAPDTASSEACRKDMDPASLVP